MCQACESDEARKQLMRKVNDLLGKDALIRLDQGLTVDEWNALNTILSGNIEGKVLHCDGFVGFCCELSDGTFTNEGFQISDKILTSAEIKSVVPHKTPQGLACKC